MKTYQLFIDGALADPSSGQWFDSVNPYTGEVWARIPRADASDVERAVLAAERAMREGEWSRMTATQRGHALRRLGEVVTRHLLVADLFRRGAAGVEAAARRRPAGTRDLAGK